MVLRLASEGRSPEAIADHLRGSAERRCARISRKATRQKRKGGRSHPSQTTIAEGHQGYRSLLPVCRSSPGAGSTAPGAQGLLAIDTVTVARSCCVAAILLPRCDRPATSVRYPPRTSA